MPNNFSSHVKKLTDLSDLSFDNDFVVMPDTSADGTDPFLKHHDIDKTNETQLYDLVTKIAADAVGPGGLDFYECTQTTMRKTVRNLQGVWCKGSEISHRSVETVHTHKKRFEFEMTSQRKNKIKRPSFSRHENNNFKWHPPTTTRIENTPASPPSTDAQ